MKRKKMDIYKVFHIIFVTAAGVMLCIGFITIILPHLSKEERVAFEENIIDAYIHDTLDEINKGLDVAVAGVEEPAAPPESVLEEGIWYDYSDIDSNGFIGTIDSVIICDKINLKKLVIRGNNDYNLDRYYFVTADDHTQLNIGNYIVYGHNSRLYGHSFNRLDELEIGDEFIMVKDSQQYLYKIEAKDRALRAESSEFFPALEKRVTLVSCERSVQPGYSEKRVIIIRAALVEEG